MPGTLLEAVGRAVSRTKIPALTKLTFWWEKADC